jgi:hypothetical protein
MARKSFAIPALMALALTSGCETADQAGSTVKSVGETVADAAGDAAKGAVSLVNVNLSDVLNDLALDLKIDKSNVPINAQIPITIAANVCGVPINVLSVSTGGSPTCTAQSTSPDLAQAVQQQLAANGSVGGGSQTVPGGTTGGVAGSGTGATSTGSPSTSTTTTTTATTPTNTTGAQQ